MSKMIQMQGTEFSVYPVGFGTVAAGLDWDGQDAYRMMDAYLDMGGNLIDTARVYSDWVPPEIGRSERVVGDWIRQRGGKHDDFVLISKGGHPIMPHMHTSRMKKADMEHDIELSLRALSLDCIDIYFYHRDDLSMSVGETLEIMEGFVKAGKIKHYGCSNWTSARINEAYEYAKAHGMQGFVANQMLYNMGQKYMLPHADDTMVAMDESMMQLHRTQPNLAMPYFGVCSGFFHMLDAKGADAVKGSNYCTQGNLALMEKINRIRKEYNATITQVLLGFFYAQDFPIVPLAGAQNISQLEEIMTAWECHIDASCYDYSL